MAFSNGLALANVALLLACACNERDIERPWVAQEVRTVHPRASALPPPTNSQGGYSIFVPLGVNRSLLALAASESLTLGQGVAVAEGKQGSGVFSCVTSMGSLSIGRGTQVGCVYALGNAFVLEDGVSIQGYVKSAATPEIRGRARAALGLLDHVETDVEEFRWGEGPLDVNRGDRVSRSGEAELEIDPGTYRDVVVGSGSGVLLRAGEYRVESLDIRPGGVLEIDNSRGSVFVWVTRALGVSGEIVDFKARSNVLFGYTGAVSPTITVPFRGTLVAPNSTVDLRAAGGPHVGSFFARRLVVADGVVIEHQPFVGAAPDFQLPDVVCKNCALIALHSPGGCCADRRSAPAAGCAEKERSSFEACEQSAGYRRGICSKLGYATFDPTCERAASDGEGGGGG